MTTFEVVAISIVTLVTVGPIISKVGELVKEGLSTVLKSVLDFFFVTVHLDNEGVSSYVVGYLRRNCRSYSLGEDYITHKMKFVEGRGLLNVFYRQGTKSLSMYFYRFMPVFVTPFIDKGTSSENKRTTLRYLRGTVNAKKLFQDAGEFLDKWDKENATRNFQIVRLSGVGNKDDGKINTKSEGAQRSRPFEESAEPINFVIHELEPVERTLSMELLSQTEAHKRLQHDLHFWKEHQEWYAKRNLPWRRGYMLHGPPGNGKTSLIRALCEDEDIPVILMDLSSMTNNQFSAAWEYARGFRPRAVLLEDFDSVFRGRQNVSTMGYLDFSTILNAIDGIEQENGMLLFVTTNHPENIDAALGQPLPDGTTTRPGRLDVSVEIPPLDYEGRLKIALRIVEDAIDAESVVAEGLDDTPAQFIERCKQFALRVLWERKNGLTIPVKPVTKGSYRSKVVNGGIHFGDPPHIKPKE